MKHNQYRRKRYSIFLFFFTCIFSFNVLSQAKGLYPPFTRWYQDPLGLKPLELSTAFGFLWASGAMAACLVFTKQDSGFQKRCLVYQEAGLGFGYKPPYTNVFQNEIGFMYRLRDWMNAGLGITAFHFDDKTSDTWSFGVRPFVRWYPYRSRNLNLFFEYGAGLSYSLARFPLSGTGWDSDTARIGTQINLITKYGTGVEVLLNQRFSLQAGARHFHLSNGNTKGIQRNPSHDSNGIFLGLLFRIKKKPIIETFNHAMDGKCIHNNRCTD